MGLVLNLLAQTIVWFGLMGAIIFGVAGTIDYTGGWLYLGVMIAISVVFGLHMARVDPGLLQERLKPPVQRDQPLADKLALVDNATFRAVGRMWLTPGGDFAHILDHAHEQLRGAGRENTKGPRAGGHHDRPYAIVRHPMYFGALFYIAGTSLVLGSWWGRRVRWRLIPLVW